MGGIVIYLGAVKKRLCRDAALVKTHSAKLTGFKQNNAQTSFSGLFRGHISTGAATDNR